MAAAIQPDLQPPLPVLRSPALTIPTKLSKLVPMPRLTEDEQQQRLQSTVQFNMCGLDLAVFVESFEIGPTNPANSIIDFACYLVVLNMPLKPSRGKPVPFKDGIYPGFEPLKGKALPLPGTKGQWPTAVLFDDFVLSVTCGSYSEEVEVGIVDESARYYDSEWAGGIGSPFLSFDPTLHTESDTIVVRVSFEKERPKSLLLPMTPTTPSLSPPPFSSAVSSSTTTTTTTTSSTSSTSTSSPSSTPHKSENDNSCRLDFLQDSSFTTSTPPPLSKCITLGVRLVDIKGPYRSLDQQQQLLQRTPPFKLCGLDWIMIVEALSSKTSPAVGLTFAVHLFSLNVTPSGGNLFDDGSVAGFSTNAALPVDKIDSVAAAIILSKLAITLSTDTYTDTFHIDYRRKRIDGAYLGYYCPSWEGVGGTLKQKHIPLHSSTQCVSLTLDFMESIPKPLFFQTEFSLQNISRQSKVVLVVTTPNKETMWLKGFVSYTLPPTHFLIKLRGKERTASASLRDPLLEEKRQSVTEQVNNLLKNETENLDSQDEIFTKLRTFFDVFQYPLAQEWVDSMPDVELAYVDVLTFLQRFENNVQKKKTMPHTTQATTEVETETNITGNVDVVCQHRCLKHKKGETEYLVKLKDFTWKSAMYKWCSKSELSNSQCKALAHYTKHTPGFTNQSTKAQPLADLTLSVGAEVILSPSMDEWYRGVVSEFIPGASPHVLVHIEKKATPPRSAANDMITQATNKVESRVQDAVKRKLAYLQAVKSLRIFLKYFKTSNWETQLPNYEITSTPKKLIASIDLNEYLASFENEVCKTGSFTMKPNIAPLVRPNVTRKGDQVKTSKRPTSKKRKL